MILPNFYKTRMQTSDQDPHLLLPWILGNLFPAHQTEVTGIWWQGRNLNRDHKLYHKHFSNIARPGYKGLPSASINHQELVKLKLMFRECITTSNFLSTLSTASESTLNNLRAARDQREKTFGLLASEPDPSSRDQYLQQLLNSSLLQMQFMLDISRSTAVAFQHLLEKFRDAHLKNTHKSLDAYHLKNICSAPISGPDLFKHSLMQEYE